MKNNIALNYAKFRYWAALAFRLPLDELIVRLVPPRHIRSAWWVDLSQVELQTKYKWKMRKGVHLCVGGEWDIQDVRPRISVYDPFDSDDIWRSDYETVRILFCEGGDFSETPQFESVKKAIITEKKTGRAKTLDDIPKYFDQLKRTFKSIKENGFLTQEKLGNSKYDEMKIHVTRSGQLCYGGIGCHRIAMAEILGIYWVPFLLESVHPIWVKQISQELNMPPHKAIVKWMENDPRIHKSRPGIH